MCLRCHPSNRWPSQCSANFWRGTFMPGEEDNAAVVDVAMVEEDKDILLQTTCNPRVPSRQCLAIWSHTMEDLCRSHLHRAYNSKHATGTFPTCASSSTIGTVVSCADLTWKTDTCPWHAHSKRWTTSRRTRGRTHSNSFGWGMTRAPRGCTRWSYLWDGTPDSVGRRICF